MVPEIWSGPFLALLPPPHLPNDPENQNFEEKKRKEKLPRDITLLKIHVYHK